MGYRELLLIIIAVLTVALSLAIVRGKKRDTNGVFSLFILAIGLWSFGLAFFYIASNPTQVLHFLRFFYISALVIPTFFMHFSLIFPNQQHLTTEQLRLIYVPTVVFSLLIVIVPDFIATDIGIRDGTRTVTVNLFGYIIYALYFIWCLFYAYLHLFKSYFCTRDIGVRIQLRFIITGTLIPYILAMIFNLLLPPWTYEYVWVGPLFAILVISVIMRGVYKHHLLDVKVITTELFTFSLWIFIFIRTLLGVDLTEKAINGALFLLTFIVGIFLIRSVRKEVSQREKIEKLAKELEGANKKLESANERLKELDKLKTEFVSLATHQIRGPVTAIKGYASMLLEGDFGTVPDEVKKPVETILESSSSLAGIVQDFLDVSRIEQGRMKYEFADVDLSKLVSDVARELAPNVEKKGLRLVLEIAPNITARADAGKMKQVIENLLDNAVKYTPEGSISVSLYLSKPRTVPQGITVRGEAERKAVLSVKDTGIGISKETLPKLFQKFSRAEDASKANMKGTGLGLYVAKQLVEAQGGTIRAESEGEGKGSTFFVELPSA